MKSFGEKSEGESTVERKGKIREDEV